MLRGELASGDFARDLRDMIKLSELLYTRGLPEKADITKLVRHRDTRYDLGLLSEEHFEIYQTNQSSPIYNCEYVVAFHAEDHSRARFHAVYRVLGKKLEPLRKWPDNWPFPDMETGPHWYQLEKLPGFDDLAGRVVIDWGSSPLAYHQWLVCKEVVEVYPAGYVREFPGHDRILLSFSDLRKIMLAPSAHREWHRALAMVAGVYLILDTHTGLQYIGSAYGGEGILGRWRDYAFSVHGGNARLIEAMKNKPNCQECWQFSILATLPLITPKDEVIVRESLYKQKLGSRAHGLNIN